MKTFLRLAVTLIILNAISGTTNAQWVTHGPYRADVACIGANNGIFYAGTLDAGVYTSVDSGLNWTTIDSGLPEEGLINTFAFNGSNIYAGTDGLYQLNSSGNYWMPMYNGLTAEAVVVSIVFSGSNMFAATENYGVFLSTDNAASWTRVNNGLTDTDVTSLTVSGSNIFAGTTNGLFLSTNNGASWTAISTGRTNKYISGLGASGAYIFAGNTSHALFVSSNNGTSWAAINNTIPDSVVNCFTVSGAVIYAGTRRGVYYSNNYGASWVAQNSSDSIITISLAISGSQVVAATATDIEVSQNGGPWTQRINNICNSFVNSLTYHAPYIFAGTTYGIFRSADSGSTWVACNNGFPYPEDIDAILVVDTDIFVSTGFNNLYVSHNNGNSWSFQQFYGGDMTSFATIGNYLFAGTLQGVYYSTDGGVNWSAQNTNFTNTVDGMAVIGSRLFAIDSYSGVYVSTDSSATWTAINTGLPTSTVDEIDVIDTNLFCASYSGVYVSTNYGASWLQVNTGLPDTLVAQIRVIGNTLYALTRDSGIYYTTNNGNSWQLFYSGVLDPLIEDLLIVNTDTFIATFGRSVWQKSSSAVVTCTNDSVSLNMAICSGDTYSFYGTNESSGGTYVHSQPNLNGCDSVITLHLTINQRPVVTVSAAGTLICYGDSSQVCAPYGFASYLWNTGDTSTCTQAHRAGYFYVSVTNGNGCAAVSDSVFVNVYPEPAGPFIVVQGDTLASYGALYYQWMYNGNFINGATGPTYIAHQQGNYSVLLTDSNGCTITSEQVFITGIQNLVEENISIYPNPSVGSWELGVMNELVGAQLQVYDEQGRIVFNSELRTQNSKLELNVSAGVYYLRISNGDVSVVRKLVKL